MARSWSMSSGVGGAAEVCWRAPWGEVWRGGDAGGRRDPARVGPDPAPRGDHPGELGGEVDVRHLDGRAGEDAGAARAARRVDRLRTRVRRDLELVARDALEAGRVVELRERDLREVRRRVRRGIDVGDDAALADRDVLRA